MLTIHIDLDECVTNNIERCHQDAECTKIEDFYTCVCLEGFSGSGRHCTGLYSIISFIQCYIMCVEVYC